MIGLEHKIFSWRLVIILRRSQTLWVNSSLYLQIWNITITPRPCWNVTIPGPGSHTLHSEWSHPRHEWSRLIICEISVHLTSPGCCHATIHCPVFPHMCPRLYWLCWPAPSVAAQCSPSLRPQPSSAHITHWRLQRQPLQCPVSRAGPWLAHADPVLCSDWRNTANTFNYCWQTSSDLWAPTLTGGQGQQPLAKFSTGIPQVLGAVTLPSRNQSDQIVWSGQKCVSSACDRILSAAGHKMWDNWQDFAEELGWFAGFWWFNFALTTLCN